MPRFDPTQPSLVPLTLHTPAFLDAWRDWCEDRRERRKPLTQRAAVIALNKLAEMTPDQAAAAIRYSIERSYTGIFPDPNWKPANSVQNACKPVSDAWRDAAKALLRSDEDGYFDSQGLTYEGIQIADSPHVFNISVRRAIEKQAKEMRLKL